MDDLILGVPCAQVCYAQMTEGNLLNKSSKKVLENFTHRRVQTDLYLVGKLLLEAFFVS